MLQKNRRRGDDDADNLKAEILREVVYFLSIVGIAFFCICIVCVWDRAVCMG